MITDCAHYQDGHRTNEDPMQPEEAAARAAQGGFVWRGYLDPDDEEMAKARDIFGLHPLAVEDALNRSQRPKIEDYEGDVTLVIARTADYDEERQQVNFGSIAIFVAPTFVINIRQGVPSTRRTARQRLEQQPELMAAGTSSALWAILDEVVDVYRPVVTGLGNDGDEFEATVFSRGAATERIYLLRREATVFSRAVHPLLGVVGAIERTAAPELRPYLRLVHEHLLVVDEQVADPLDRLATVLQVSMTVNAARQADYGLRQDRTIQQLTILATIFLPLTFISGLFGQVFAWQVRHFPTYTEFIVYGLAVVGVPLVVLVWWLRARGRPAGPRAEAGR